MNSERFTGLQTCRARSSWLISGHGLTAGLLLLTLAGCGGSAAAPSYEGHGGHMIDLPGQEQMQLEFAEDDQRQRLVVYVVEKGTLAPFPIACKKLDVMFRVGDENVELSLTSDPQPEDPKDQSSRFSISYDELPTALHGAADFTAKFTLEVQGQAISGTLQHKDDHTHDHHGDAHHHDDDHD